MKGTRVIIKRPDEKYGHVAHINTSLENLQKIVGGYVEEIKAAGSVILCNEDGKLKHLDHNMYFKGYNLVGTIIVIGSDGDDFTDLNLSFDIWKWLVDLDNLGIA